MELCRWTWESSQVGYENSIVPEHPQEPSQLSSRTETVCHRSKVTSKLGWPSSPVFTVALALLRIAANMLFPNKLSPSQGHKCCLRGLGQVQRPVQNLYCVWGEGGSSEEGTSSSWLYKSARADLTVSPPTEQYDSPCKTQPSSQQGTS